ncbi:WD REPEAT DOMAIN 9 [Salix purpurea]|uniref:WD REPEAT DOMAIN 9 n=1 Tax=Salix purpurea TaxID=77065 RepID=A0A9Q0Z2A6_SALPP|nr:WD REPEAT DOMAIN 9 [Salix purpurea]
MQDLLCDSGMIPYTEPYQSMYQQRRLGALGVEWKPSTVRFAVGPDFSLDPDNQMLALADLDVLVEPLPDFIDAMDWEPENDMQSDDNDSEYNAPEEYSSEAEQGRSNSSSSVDPECSAEDSEAEGRDGFQGSKRRKQNGRRVKRKNLDECDGNTTRSNRTRKSRIGRKASKRKSSDSKALRPQRVAARNALSLFSKITGTVTDGEDEDGSEGDLSETESGTQDSNIESDESDRSLRDEGNRNLKGKDILEEPEDFAKYHEFTESHLNTIKRRRLVLKLPVHDSSKIALQEFGMHKGDNQVDLVGSSSKAPQEATEVNGVPTSSRDPGYFSGDAHGSGMDGRRRSQINNYPLDLTEECKNGDIRWGGAKARTSNRQRLGESISSAAYTGSSACLDEHNENNLNRYSELQEDNDTISPTLEVKNNVDKGAVPVNERNAGADTSELVNDVSNGKEHPTFNRCLDSDKLPTLGHMVNGNNNPPDLRESLPSFSTKIRIRSKKILKDSLDNQENSGCDLSTDKPANMTQNSVKEMLGHNGSNGIAPEYKGDEMEESDTQIGEISMPSMDNSVGSRSDPKRMFDVVYRRSKPGRGRISSEGDSSIREDTFGACVPHLDSRGDSYEGTFSGSHRTCSMDLKAPTHDANMASNNLQLGQGHESDDTCRDAHNDSINRCQLSCEEWGSSSRMTARLRSTRNRKASNHFHDTGPVDGRKLHQSAKKASWLMLSTHEEGSRYIPQQGDEVAYLRQGHQEYLDRMKSKEAAPWKIVKGNIRAVEFCKVEALEYAALAGSGDGCCKMTLRFVDPTSSAFQKSFKLTLPEMTGFPDFLVERTRFNAAIQRNWSRRDKCKVWWKNEGEEDGDWWYGRVLYTKPKSSEFPDSPWERCTVQYKSDPKELHEHSPWELFDDDDTQLEQPCIDEEITNKLLSAFAKLEQSGKKGQDHYGVEKLRQASHKSNFINRFPVPFVSRSDPVKVRKQLL